MENLVVIAIGGNSLIQNPQEQTIADQYAAVLNTAKRIIDLIESGHRVVVTHGNGPQVGLIMQRAQIASQYAGVAPIPLVECDARTQGEIGYQIQQALDNEFRARNLTMKLTLNNVEREILKTAVTMVTQVEVDKNDKAFNYPTKPIGNFYSEEEVKKMNQEKPEWKFIEDSNRGYRRVVASPEPKMILELEVIELMLDAGLCIVAAGGGGIPVIRKECNSWQGIDAVIDKDKTSSLMARQLGAEQFIISTAVDKVYVNFGKCNQIPLDTVKVSELQQYISDGHFPPGSMLPKIQATMDFVQKTGREAIITNPANLKDAVEGKAGTHIKPD